MKAIVGAMSAMLAVCILDGAWAAEWYVAPPPLGNNSNPGTNQLPFATIQRGIDAASSGDTVIVALGTYVENIQFNGKNIILTSTNPADAYVVNSTIIDGNKSGSVVTFSGTETEACVLSGFTIRKGVASLDGGGVNGNGMRATIQNNAITGNSAGNGGGGGLAYCDATIQNNRITGNSAQWGGGLGSCNGTIQNNTITGNSATTSGGGLYDCHGAIQNNRITGNSAQWGGGLGSRNGTIQDNAITGNSAQAWGGGLSDCNGTIQNNAITGNSATDFGGGLAWCDATIRNCIIWGNMAPTGPQLYDLSIPTYSCIQDWTEGGEGNITTEPLFFDPLNMNFRLRPLSPCIDVGFTDPTLPPTDIAGMHRVMYGGRSLTVDMGAWEFYINTLSGARNGNGNAVLRWSSLAGKAYRVEHSGDMLSWQTAAETVPSIGDTTTTWTDTTAPFLSPFVRIKHYRVLEK